ncbi:MAG: TlyA family RNA methyltransferase [Spirochaetia bacterium]|nr:TlyA family RNA methyltransferase [Spirochaetia bacterium]
MKEKRVTLLKALALQYDQYSKDQLTAYIVCKNVFVDGVLATDPRQLVSMSSSLSFSFDAYVSRGGYKLEHGLKVFGLDVSNLVMLDAGSSTGGFTDCLLKRGAKLVHSVDVGYNQLDWRLRTNEQVIVHERQNIMTLTALEPSCDAAVCDLSFRSIAGAASHILSLCRGGYLLSLVKPQFETPKGLSDFNGVVQDRDLLMQIMDTVYDLLEDDHVGVHDLALSPLKGHKGNCEFLALLRQEQGWTKPRYNAKVAQLLTL